MQPGVALPSERKLSEMLSVSRNTLREAMGMLEERQVVEVKKGSGCYLNSTLAELEEWDGIKSDKIHHVVQNQLEARFLIIPSVAALVIEKMNDRDIKNLEETVIRLSKAIINRNFSEISTEDNKFREILAESTDNPILIKMMKQLEGNNQITWELFIAFPKEDLNKIFACYVKTLEAIRERNVENVKLYIENNVLTMCSLLIEYTDVKFSDQMLHFIRKIYNQQASA